MTGSNESIAALRNRGVAVAFGLLVMCVLTTTAILFSADVAAQGRPGNAAGSSVGVNGGGVSAANRGGAGGVSNPNPGGGSASGGESGLNSGPQSTENSRSGYLGGRTNVSAEPGILPPGSIVNVTTARFGKCPSAGSDVLSPQARLSGSNAERLDSVSQYLNRGPQQGGKSSSTYLLADLQEELQRDKPDLTLAGTYLGIILKTAVTQQLVKDIGESLCSPIKSGDAEFISKVAEAQQRNLKNGK